MRSRDPKSPKGLPSKSPKKSGKMKIFSRLNQQMFGAAGRKNRVFCCFSLNLCVLVRGVFGGMPSEDEASEELPPVTDSEEEKPVYTTQCTNLERWQVLPTKPGRRCLGAAVFIF